MSLQLRLSLLVLALVTAGVAAAAWAAFVVTEHELRAEADTFLLQRATSIAGGQRGPVPGDIVITDVPEGRPPMSFFQSDAAIQVLDEDAVPLFEVAGQPPLPIADAEAELARSGGQEIFRDVDIDGVHHRLLTFPVEGGGAVQVARDMTETDDVLAGLGIRLAAIGAAVAAVAAGASLVLARRATRPIRRLTATAEHVAATEDLASPILVDRTDEVGRLATSFNAMLAALATSREQQHRLVQDASHELRTPLTSLRTNIEVLARTEDLDADEHHRLVADIELELGELTHLANELVDLATEGRIDEPVQPVELAGLVDTVASRFRRRTGRSIVVATDRPATVDAHPTMLERAVSNLVDNALKFSAPDTSVELRVTGTRVRVRDHGPGIAPDDRERVFDRFYRGAADRTRPGSGLGLAIVRQAVLAEHGTLVVQDAPDGGAILGFDLPEPTPEPAPSLSPAPATRREVDARSR